MCPKNNTMLNVNAYTYRHLTCDMKEIVINKTVSNKYHRTIEIEIISFDKISYLDGTFSLCVVVFATELNFKLHV